MIAEKDMRYYAEFIVGTVPLALDQSPIACENYDWMKGFLEYALAHSNAFCLNGGEKKALSENDRNELMELSTDEEGLLSWENLELYDEDRLIMSAKIHGKLCRIYDLTHDDAQKLVEIARNFKIFFRADVYGLLDQ